MSSADNFSHFIYNVENENYGTYLIFGKKTSPLLAFGDFFKS